MSSNPRKFSEKIALQQKKQAEGTAAYENIIREVCAATKRTKENLSSPITLRRSYSPQFTYNVKEELNNLRKSLDIKGLPSHTKTIPSGSFATNPVFIRKPPQNISPLTINNFSSSSFTNSNNNSFSNINSFLNGNIKPQKRKKYSCDRHREYSPYSNNHLAMPLDNWRRASSDSSIHANLINNTAKIPTCNTPSKDQEISGLSNLSCNTNRPKSCEGSETYRHPTLRRLIFDERMTNPKRTTSNCNVSNNFPAGTNIEDNTYGNYNGYGRSLTNGNTLGVGYGSLPDIMRSQKLAHSINNKINDLITNNKNNQMVNYNDALNLSHSLNINNINYQAFNNDMSQGESFALEADSTDEFVDLNGYVDGVGDDVAFYNWNSNPAQNTDKISEFVSKDNVYPNESTSLNCNNEISTQFNAKNIHKFAPSNPYNTDAYIQHNNQEKNKSISTINQNFIQSYANVQPTSPSITLTEMDNLNQPVKTVLLESPSFGQLDISPSWDKFIQTSDVKSVAPFCSLNEQLSKGEKINLPLNMFSLLHNNQSVQNMQHTGAIKPNHSDCYDGKVSTKSHLNQLHYMPPQQTSVPFEIAPSTFPIQSRQERGDLLKREILNQDNILNLTSKIKTEFDEKKYNQKYKSNVDPLLNSTTYANTFLDTSSCNTNASKKFPSLSCLGDSFDDHLIDEINVEDLLKFDTEDLQGFLNSTKNEL